MPANPTDPDAHLCRLVDEGFEVSVVDGYLVVDRVPYRVSARETAMGALICPYDIIDGVPTVGTDHQCWFTGSVPCTADGTSLEPSMVSERMQQIVAGRMVSCRFSNKPDPIGDFLDNHYNKVMHYARKLARHTQQGGEQRAKGSLHFRQKPSVFLYPNDAVTAAGLDVYADKLRLRRVCIVGAGGTGSYLLDALAKEEIEQIDLYDDDVIERKNAFRFPGAMTHEEAHSSDNKALWLAQKYGDMRLGVNGHAVRIDASNVDQLTGADFVFIAVDDGPSRGLIARFLVEQRIPFIDVGIGVERVPETTSLNARARVTLVTPETGALVDELPTSNDADVAIYNNIQIVEINAINAMLAVVCFKQYLGFYATTEATATLKYIVSWNELVSRHLSPREN